MTWGASRSHEAMRTRIEAIIQKKERGTPNTADDLSKLVDAAVCETASEDQLVRWLRAVKKYDMLPDELAAYTLALARGGNGRVLNWGTRVTAAKHAPGGVGENTSGPVDAIVASCGVLAPIYTGRRLEHTPGTVDRYGSIPGFRIFLSPEEFTSQIDQIGIAMTGQTPQCAPGDGKIYALREKFSAGRPDSESLVQVPALIIGSVLSKKIASGATNFGMLMTFGDGAFLANLEEARKTAERMQAVGTYAQARISAQLTSLHAPLGDHLATTSLAVQESIRLLRGDPVAPDLRAAVLRVSALMLLAAGKGETFEQSYELAKSALNKGAALSTFGKFLEYQGADPQICHDPGLLPKAQNALVITAPRSGYINMRTRELGRMANYLANGEYGSEDFDPAAGIVLTAQGRYGSWVALNDHIATVHGGSRAEEIAARLAEALTVEEAPPPRVERFPEMIVAA